VTHGRPFVEQAAACDVGAHGLVVATGRDTWTFLQSLLSQDVAVLEPGAGAASLLLTPQGKLVVVLRVLAVADGAWLDCEPELVGALREGLDRFRIRVDVALEAVPAARVVVRGAGSVEVAGAALGVDVPAAQHAHVSWHGSASGDAALVVRADWPIAPGVDVVGRPDAVDAARDALAAAGMPFVDWTTYDARRIEAGVPLQARDLDDKLIPQEAFLDRDAVSFTKGCFLGQELVCRIDTRGHVNRYLRLVDVSGVQSIPEGAEVVTSGKVMGVVTSSAPVPGEEHTVALAMIRREVEPPADVSVRWDGAEHPAKVTAVP
jgi:folate-binding protein YgfZ